MPDWVFARRRVIGDRIREARRRAELSQVPSGERVGLDHKTTHRYETAQRAPGLNELLLIADALGVPLPELVKRAAPGRRWRRRPTCRRSSPPRRRLRSFRRRSDAAT